MKVAYCTGFWSTNIGNGFFSLGVEHVLKKILGPENVTVVSDYQTYTTSYGKRLYPHKNQLHYIANLDVDYIVLAGPVISKYFLPLWKDILLRLKARGVGYIILSAGTMKLDEASKKEVQAFFQECPPYVFSSRERETYDTFGKYAVKAYNGICFSFFAPDYYTPCQIDFGQPYWISNFDKIIEPQIWMGDENRKHTHEFTFEGENVLVNSPATAAAKTDRFTDALIYIRSFLPAPKREDHIGQYKLIRTDQRFHPHFRSKIYAYKNSFCADIPYGYINLYANSRLTLSDRVHSCAVTLAYGHSAMLFAKTNRVGLLERVGAGEITKKPVTLDMDLIREEKAKMVEWLKTALLCGERKEESL